MGPEGVVLPAPAIGQALGLSHRGEQLGVEEFVLEPANERLGIAVLPWRAWLDVRGCGAAVLAPSSERVGNELRAVIAADERRCCDKSGRPSARRTRKADERRAPAEGDRADRRGECCWRQPGECLR